VLGHAGAFGGDFYQTAFWNYSVGVSIMPASSDIPLDRDPLASHTASPAELKELLAAERAGKPFLALRDRQGHLHLPVLDGDGPLNTLGRRTEMDIALPWDSEVSGLHAELRCMGGAWTITDDGLSRNGTYVNGQRVSGRQRLRHGDRIRVGRTTIAFNAHEAPVEETISAGERPVAQQLTDIQRRILVALCRPYREGRDFATPATNQQIADEVFLSVDGVKMHLRTLFGKLELGELPQNQKRVRLAECALQFGLVSPRDLD
jgi:hypothetical protein